MEMMNEMHGNDIMEDGTTSSVGDNFTMIGDELSDDASSNPSNQRFLQSFQYYILH
jgi:hypothetical protein